MPLKCSKNCCPYSKSDRMRDRFQMPISRSLIVAFWENKRLSGESVWKRKNKGRSAWTWLLIIGEQRRELVSSCDGSYTLWYFGTGIMKWYFFVSQQNGLIGQKWQHYCASTGLQRGAIRLKKNLSGSIKCIIPYFMTTIHADPKPPSSIGHSLVKFGGNISSSLWRHRRQWDNSNFIDLSQSSQSASFKVMSWVHEPSPAQPRLALIAGQVVVIKFSRAITFGMFSSEGMTH